MNRISTGGLQAREMPGRVCFLTTRMYTGTTQTYHNATMMRRSDTRPCELRIERISQTELISWEVRGPRAGILHNLKD